MSIDQLMLSRKKDETQDLINPYLKSNYNTCTRRTIRSLVCVLLFLSQTQMQSFITAPKIPLFGCMLPKNTKKIRDHLRLLLRATGGM